MCKHILNEGLEDLQVFQRVQPAECFWVNSLDSILGQNPAGGQYDIYIYI